MKRAEAAVAEKQAEVAAKEAEVAEEREGIIADEKAREIAARPGTGAAAAGAFALADQLYFLKVRPRERSGSISGTLSILDPGPPEREAHLAGGLRPGPGLLLLQGLPAGGGPGERSAGAAGAPAAAEPPHPGAGQALAPRRCTRTASC